jgi:hypothetical protein
MKIEKTKKFILCRDLEVTNEDDNRLQVLKITFDEDEEKKIVSGVHKSDAKYDHRDNCLKPNSIEPPLESHHVYLVRMKTINLKEVEWSNPPSLIC